MNSPTRNEGIEGTDPAALAWQEWSKKKDPATMSNVVRILEPDIKKFATSYASQVSPAIAKAKAKKYAIDAVKTYDPAMGASLKTHFYNHIRPLAREVKSMTESVSSSKHYETMANKYVNYVRSFEAENGREPDDSEIMDGLGLTPKQLSVMIASVKYEIPEGQLENYDFEQKEDQLRNKIDMWTDFVYHDLSPKGKKILDMKMGRHGHPPMTNLDVSVKLGIPLKEVAEYSEKIARTIINGANLRPKTA